MTEAIETISPLDRIIEIDELITGHLADALAINDHIKRGNSIGCEKSPEKCIDLHNKEREELVTLLTAKDSALLREELGKQKSIQENILGDEKTYDQIAKIDAAIMSAETIGWNRKNVLNLIIGILSDQRDLSEKY